MSIYTSPIAAGHVAVREAPVPNAVRRTSTHMQSSLTLWMTLVLLVLVVEALWGQRISIPLWMAGLLPPAMMLATRHRERVPQLRTLQTSPRRS